METPLAVEQKHVFICAKISLRTKPFTPKRSQKRRLTIFRNNKKISPTTTKYFRIRFPSVPGLSPGHTFSLVHPVCARLCLGTEAAGVSVPPRCGLGRPQMSITMTVMMHRLSLWHAGDDDVFYLFFQKQKRAYDHILRVGGRAKGIVEVWRTCVCLFLQYLL